MKCDCNCNAKCKMLGGLEQKIMDILWNSPTPLKPSEIVKSLSNSHAYTTITTVLKRMTDKGIVKRVARGNLFLYQPVLDKSAYACQCLDDLFDRLFDAFGNDVVIAFNKVSRSKKYSI